MAEQFFGRVYTVARRAIFLDRNRNIILNALWANTELQKKIIELNTKGQLFEKGVDANGRLLSDIGGSYSPLTMKIAAIEGRPKKSFGIIDLHDEGDFYDSFAITIGTDCFFINAVTTGKYDQDLTIRWGADILGLNDESTAELKEQILINYAFADKVIEFLLAA